MPNPICHWELMVNDVEKAKAFYRRVFDWTIEGGPAAGYDFIRTGTEPGGGMMAKPAAAPMAALNVYFLVEDVDRTLRSAADAGATVVVPKTEIPDVGSFGMFLDPDSIPIGVFTPKAR